MLGKWHLCPEDEYSLASTKRNWPVGRGMERFYGFLGGETNQWYPDLVYDNHYVDQPYGPEDGYHLTTDLVDHAIQFIGDAKVVAPDKPFFMYFCPGATHAPHHAPKEWIDKYKGKFDMGYERYRELVFESQKRARRDARRRGADAAQPLRRSDERGRQAVDARRHGPSVGVAVGGGEDAVPRGWPRCTRASSRHTDHEIGRLLDYLEQTGELDDTIVVLCSDNGASGEGGPNGSVNENKFFNGIPDALEENLQVPRRPRLPADVQPLPDGLGGGVQHADEDVEALQLRGRHRGRADRVLAERHRGARRAAAPVLPRHRHRADDVRLPRRRAARRRQGLPPGPARGREPALDVRGRRLPRRPRRRRSSRCSARARSGTRAGRRWPSTRRRRRTGATSPRTAGSCTTPKPIAPRCTTWPAGTPRRSGSWWTSGTTRRASTTACRSTTAPRSRSCSRSGRSSPLPAPGTSTPAGITEVPEASAVNVRNRSFTIAAEVEIADENAGGVLFAHGSRFGGHALYLKDGTLRYVYNFCGITEQLVVGSTRIPTGKVVLSAGFEKEGDGTPDVRHPVAVRRRARRWRSRRSARSRASSRSSGEGLNVGRDGADPVTQDYPGRAALAADRRHRQGGARRRLRRTVRGPREGSGRGLHARLTARACGRIRTPARQAFATAPSSP